MTIAKYALPSGELAEQINPHTYEAISVVPLFWSHAEFVIAVCEYIENQKEVLSTIPNLGSGDFGEFAMISYFLCRTSEVLEEELRECVLKEAEILVVKYSRQILFAGACIHAGAPLV
jgi:hypothetical protein